jgi:hypothetical protein
MRFARIAARSAARQKRKISVIDVLIAIKGSKSRLAGNSSNVGLMLTGYWPTLPTSKAGAGGRLPLFARQARAFLRARRCPISQLNFQMPLAKVQQPQGVLQGSLCCVFIKRVPPSAGLP